MNIEAFTLEAVLRIHYWLSGKKISAQTVDFDRLLAEIPCGVDRQCSHPWYDPRWDVLHLPEQYSGDEALRWLLRLVIHSTGHPDCLNRFSQTDLQMERVIREIGTLVICTISGIRYEPVECPAQAFTTQRSLRAVEFALEAVDYINDEMGLFIYTSAKGSLAASSELKTNTLCDELKGEK